MIVLDKDGGRRHLWVDVLRAVAILMVVMVHAGQYGLKEAGLPEIMTGFLHTGGRGVQLFFLISGFTILLTYTRHRQKERLHVSNFYIRRFFRIAPMFYLGILYYLFQDGLGGRYWLGDASGVSIPNILASFLFVHGFNPYYINSIVPGEWSVGVEMFFYFLFPFLFFRLKSMFRLIFLFWVSLLIKGGLQYWFASHVYISSKELWGNYLFIYFPSQLPIFVLGLMLYHVVEEKTIKPVHLAALLLPGAILNTYGFPFIDNGIMNFGILFFLVAILCWRAVTSAVIVKQLGWIGKISFSMYLTHFLVLHWLERWGLLDLLGVRGMAHAVINFCIRYSIVTLLTVMLSSALYLIVEKPFMRFGNILIKKREDMAGACL